jgi:hypothetical protein
LSYDETIQIEIQSTGSLVFLVKKHVTGISLIKESTLLICSNAEGIVASQPASALSCCAESTCYSFTMGANASVEINKVMEVETAKAADGRYVHSGKRVWLHTPFPSTFNSRNML